MTTPDEPKPKIKLKKWQIVVLVLVALTIIGALSDGSSTSPTPTPQVSASPETTASFTGEVTRWEPINPASGRAVFTIYNTGTGAGTPKSCTVRVQDASGTYKGYDFISGFSEIKPGAKFMGNVVLTVTKEGSYFVTNGSVDCE